MNEAYKKQVGLLLDVLPEVAKEECFAMHGGTAINLFVRDMPRLSVDIDLTYVEIAERSETLDGINAALLRIKERIESLRSSIRIQHKANVCKLLLDEHGTTIKIEVNMVGRGLLGEAAKVQLCDAAQEAFDAFCVIPMVPLAQLYGGKLCAALDRQHPRDLFDVKLLLDNEGFTEEIKHGFLFGLVSSNRPTYEMLNPHLQDQHTAFVRQFEGMSTEVFSYEDYVATRHQLIEIINTSLDDNDKAFLLSLNRLEPDWSIYDYQDFPSVRWKLLNLQKFKKENPEKYQQQLSDLESILE
ncbi:nucleotidyl transferase AbiEii/AbiGii toxin family protein [Dasania sp. GY-MA-18]|uniref:Nucleotidyl transferase AbiEii/AbiGii toxin family protein n=1 Tax=Dasania phycosphaerae TaxID=2950436 RepID=A0A9J6RI33_9GAMM|nr:MULTISPECIES: nucleotidyl transferase AbiEii/AbiGii toxin family protein [Dasania]MCR8921598.1 nucleotidyl transferase AbiEii/AbiGii toxin family protein [Dasania sp. GY-MA-18]MCZ0864026.1 nucleotidyl transferase AbiEii/AbiGii toxin family protein [Dasania phycosphaerae]MCZ0867754.1 nucleotidyl transferase AbiEii/AbiGii toxin family protein [Dasania phycosphaerae]